MAVSLKENAFLFFAQTKNPLKFKNKYKLNAKYMLFYDGDKKFADVQKFIKA
jgi:hypothetical protein